MINLKNPYRRKNLLVNIIQYMLLSIGGIAMLFPYLWMISTSVKIPGTWYNLRLIPEQVTFQHYLRLLDTGLMPRWYLNSIVVSIISTVSVAFFSSLAGYTFAKYKFWGRDLIFIIILTAIMIPTEMMIIPWYVAIVNLKWIDTYAGILMPGMITTFAVFIMRQFMAGIPNELLDAGRIDGVSEFGLFWQICLPMAKSAVSLVMIFNFLGIWNDYLWPLIATNDQKIFTLQVGLSRLNSSETGANWGGTMAGAALASVPMLIFFLFFQKQIVKGVSLSGLKG